MFGLLLRVMYGAEVLQSIQDWQNEGLTDVGSEDKSGRVDVPCFKAYCEYVYLVPVYVSNRLYTSERGSRTMNCFPRRVIWLSTNP